jgi:hypothetical protein
VDFYQGGLFRGAIETMGEKREFVRHVLDYMQDHGFIREWILAGEANRHDYTITLADRS